MMKRYPNLILAVALALAWGLSALQGMRVAHLHDSDRFYRWILAACSQFRLTGHPGMARAQTARDPEDMRDEQLFAELILASNRLLPAIPERPEDHDVSGQPLPLIVRYTKPFLADDETETSGLDTRDQVMRDKMVWNLARGPKLASVRQHFLTYVRENRLSGVSAQFGLNQMYAPGDSDYQEPVSLGSMFFGFRKMAANFVWLQVDKYWHEGKTHRMVPLMNTCVMLDPTFVDAYLIGAWHLAYNATAGKKPTPWELRKYSTRHKAWIGPIEELYFAGVDFLQDGILNNPRNYKLYFDLGYGIYEEKLEDHPNAILYLSEAIQLQHDRWVPRTLYRIMGYNEQYEQAIAGWRRYIQRLPDTDAAKEIAPRFIQINQGMIYERDSRRMNVRADAAEELASRTTEESEADNYLQLAEEARSSAAELRETAREVWEKLLQDSGGQEAAAIGRLARMQAEDLVAKGDALGPYEAIGILEKARLESSRFFWEALDLIIEIKNEAGIPLALTESSYVARQQLEHEYTALLPKSIGGTKFEFSEDSWYQEGFHKTGAQPEPVLPDSDELLKLKVAHPEIARVLELEGPIVFKAGDQWYRFTRQLPPNLRLPQAAA